jgi:hypothetical protein
VLGVLAVGGLLFGAGNAVASSDFTWTGASTTDGDWSDGTNWQGGSAPGGSIDTLTFPALTSPACSGDDGSGGAACYEGTDDLGSLTANELSIDDGSGYLFAGPSELTLGSSGIDATTSSHALDAAQFNIPISWSDPQTWSIDGGSAGQGELIIGGADGSSPLAINLSRGGVLGVGEGQAGDVEASEVTITGADSAERGLDSYDNGAVGVGGGKLNYLTGDPVDVTDAVLFGVGMVGPLTSTGGVITVGYPLGAFATSAGEWVTGSGALSVSGSVTLDSASAVQFYEGDPAGYVGPSPSSPQLSATADIALNGAELVITGVSPSGSRPGVPSSVDSSCPSLTPGTATTLVATTGTVDGTFGNAPNGATIPLDCDSPSPPTVTINYTPNAVTATVASAGVAQTTTTLSTTTRSTTTDAPVWLTAAVTADGEAPSGTVTFDIDGSPIPGCQNQPLIPDGARSETTCATSFAAAGSPHAVRATFVPSTAAQAGSSSSPQFVTVGPLATRTLMAGFSVVPENRYTYEAQVAPAANVTLAPGGVNPTGTVEFFADGNPIPGCTAVPTEHGSQFGQFAISAGMSVATCTSTENVPGLTVTATYSGDASFDPSSTAPSTSMTLDALRVRGAAVSVNIHVSSTAHLQTMLVELFATDTRRDGKRQAIATSDRSKPPGQSSVLVGSATVHPNKAGTAKATVKLNSAGRRLLSAFRKLTVRLEVTQPKHLTGRPLVTTTEIHFTEPA